MLLLQTKYVHFVIKALQIITSSKHWRLKCKSKEISQIMSKRNIIISHSLNLYSFRTFKKSTIARLHSMATA